MCGFCVFIISMVFVMVICDGLVGYIKKEMYIIVMLVVIKSDVVIFGMF